MACGLRCAAAFFDGTGILFAAKYAVALRRCRCPSAHRSPHLRLAESGISTAWLGVAAPAASAVAAVCAEDVVVANGHGGRVAFDGLLCVGLRGHLPAGEAVVASIRCDCRGGVLCAESRTALHADDGDDGAALSRGDDLERSANRGAWAGAEGRRAATGIAHAGGGGSGAGLRDFYPVRWMDFCLIRMVDCVLGCAAASARTRGWGVCLVYCDAAGCSVVLACV